MQVAARVAVSVIKGSSGIYVVIFTDLIVLVVITQCVVDIRERTVLATFLNHDKFRYVIR